MFREEGEVLQHIATCDMILRLLKSIANGKYSFPISLMLQKVFSGLHWPFQVSRSNQTWHTTQFPIDIDENIPPVPSPCHYKAFLARICLSLFRHFLGYHDHKYASLKNLSHMPNQQTYRKLAGSSFGHCHPPIMCTGGTKDHFHSPKMPIF